MGAILELRNIAKTYTHGNFQDYIIRDINIVAKNGEVIAITGPSGSGKSTILQIAGLLDAPSEGEILLNGMGCLTLSDRERTKIRRESIGFIYQFHHLISELSVIQNIILPRLVLGQTYKKVKQQVMEIAEHLHMQHIINNTNVSVLSGGERQRVAVARAFINNPQLILADEPTGNLDAKNSMAVFQLFLNAARRYNATVIIVTHNSALAQEADRIINLELDNNSI